MKAYCINLDRRPDRLDHMTRQFNRQGMSFERVPAIDGQRPDVIAQASKCLPSSCGARMSASVYACFQSHREAWRRLVASGEPFALVLEDDLLLADGMAATLENYWIPQDADLVRLETFGTRLHVDAGHGHHFGSRQLLRLRSGHLGAGCYVVSAKAAQLLLAKSTNFNEPVDVFLFGEGGASFDALVTYQMIPSPAVQGKRPISATTNATWSATSITNRFAPGASTPTPRAETPSHRLIRRVKEEFRAHLQGTRYIVVPHG